MGAGGFLQKTSAPLPLMTTYGMSLISAGSNSVDSGFKETPSLWHLKITFVFIPKHSKKDK
jgi:hypothetical protein